MKKQILLLALLITAIIGLAPIQTEASHNTGGDISYTYLGPNTYLLRYRFYRDCSGISAPTSVSACYRSTTLGFSSTITLNPIPGTGNEIPPSPCLPPIVSTCQGGSGYGVQEYIYEGVVVLPGTATDWRFEYAECCRNPVTTGPNASLYVYVTLDNQNFPTNNSAYFNTIPVTQFCVNNPFYYPQGAVDIDGDILVYTLITAQTAGGCPANPTPETYISPWSPTNPLTTASGTFLDPNTGVISFTPTQVMNGVIAILCEEFDPVTGAKKAELNRDIQINIITNCNIIPPAFDSAFNANGVSIIVDGTINLTCDDTTFYLVFDDSAQIQCGSIVPTDIRVTMPNGFPNPVVSAVGVNCVNGLTDSILVTVLNPFPAGISYAYTKVGNDGNTFLSECGSGMPELDSIALAIIDNTILVVDSTSALVGCVFDKIDLVFNQPLNCYGIAANGSDFTVVDANGTNIPVTGALCGGAANPNAPHFSNLLTILTNPGTTGVGPLYVISNVGSDGNTISNSCETYISDNDTIAVVTVLTYIPVNLGNDITQCDTPPYPVLNMGVLAPTAVFNWTLNGTSLGINNDSLLANQTGTYIGTVGVGAICSGTDTIVINLLPTPTVTITDGTTALGDTINLCTGDPIPALTATTTGTGFQWSNNGTAVAGATNATFTPTTSGLYSVQSAATGAPCFGNDQIRIIINPDPGASLGSNQTVCSNQALPVLTTNQVAGASYSWTANGSPITGANSNQYQPTSATGGTTTYEVTVTSAAGCISTATMDLTVIQITAVALGNDVSYCSGVAATDLNAATTGAVSYQWYNSSGIITGAINPNYTPVTDVSTNYIVVVDFGNGCTSTDTIAVNYVTQITITSNDVTYCQGSAPGPLNASSTVAGLTYTWSFNGNQVGTGQSLVPANGPGVYTVVGDFNGQCNGTVSALVTEIELPAAMSITGANNYCVGDVISDLQCDYSFNGQFNTVYSWTENGNPFGGNTQTITPSNTAGTYNYSVIITNSANGQNCTATANAVVNIYNAPVLDALVPNSYCQGETIDPLVAQDTSSLATTYTWSLNGNIIPGEVLNVHNPNNPPVGINTYVVEAEENGCKTTASVIITINALPAPALSATANGQTATDVFRFCLTDGQLPVIASGLTNPANYNYTWTLNGVAIGTGQTQGMTVAGTYQLEVEDIATGCRSTDNIIGEVIPCALQFYNIITPDGNGQNDVFFIENLENFIGKKLVVYNRWGKEVFSSDSYNNKWDGGDLSAGSYFYILDADNGVEKTSHKGILEIVK